MLYTPLSLAAQTAYAQLHEALQSREIARGVADAPGSFNQKTVAGKTYWYYQYRDLDGKLRQAYLGPHSERLATLIAAREHAERGNDPQIKALTQSASTLGFQTVAAPHLTIIKRLADAGFFRAGGVLVGTHAFLSAGNMLGVRWGDASRTEAPRQARNAGVRTALGVRAGVAELANTRSIGCAQRLATNADDGTPIRHFGPDATPDFAHAGRHLQVALASEARLELGDVIDSLGMGFVPAASLSGVRDGRWMHPKEPGFVLDFLTPMGRGEQELVHVKAFNAEFQALRFMEFSLQDIESSAVFTRTQGCLVNVPNPARMAVHKLIVAGLRRTAERTKANKDLQQAAMLYRWYQDHDPAAWDAALADAHNRGPKWRTHVDSGLAQMQAWLGRPA